VFNRNQLTDLLAAAEDEGGDVYALTCLLALNGVRVSEACGADITDPGGTRYQRRYPKVRADFHFGPFGGRGLYRRAVVLLGTTTQ
jgi:integrase